MADVHQATPETQVIQRYPPPRRVREFVDLWEREVLAKWQLPPEKTAPKKKSRFAATASVA